MPLNPFRHITQFTVILLLVLSAAAQQPAPAIPSTGHPSLDQYRASRIAVFTSGKADFAISRLMQGFGLTTPGT